MVALDVTTVSHMAPGRFFRDHTSAVNALDFHHTEDALVTTGDDDAIHLYNTNTGAKTRTLYSKKYGCTNVRFTHSACPPAAGGVKLQCRETMCPRWTACRITDEIVDKCPAGPHANRARWNTGANEKSRSPTA